MPDRPSMFDRAMPVLASLDIAASLDFFHKLGFETHDFGDSDYGIAIREHIEIHFWLCTDRHIAENTSCYVRMNDIHALHAARGSRGCARPERLFGEVRSGDGWAIRIRGDNTSVCDGAIR